MLPPIADILRDTTILLTGATGFVGKVILLQLLRHVPETTRLICLVRSDVERPPEVESEESAVERFQTLVVRSELFRPMRRAGILVDELLARRVEVLAGDVGQPNLGLAPDRFRDLAARVDVIVNSAGHVDLEGPLDVALSANTLGPDELLRLALAWRAAGRHAPPALAHVSTCFVSGTRSGPIREEIVINDYPRREELGIPFFPGDEMQALQETVERVRAEIGLRSPGAERWLTQRLAVEGRARAGVWGWPNVHTFTKALGERALAAQHAEVPLSIVRPSIIGAAMRDPVPGWTESVDTIPMLALIAWRGHRYYPIHPRQTIDVIPVDFVANATIAIAAMTLSGEASGVYHLSSGDRNPLDATSLIDLTDEGLRRERRRRPGRGVWTKPNRIRSAFKGTIVSEQTYRRYSAPAQARWWSRAAAVLERLPLRSFWARGAGLLRQWARDARFADSVFEAYRPFLYAAQPIFEADRTHDLYARLTSEDRERFAFAPHTINWRRYWIDVQIEGVLQHAFPAMGEELRPLHPALAGESVGDLLDSAVRRHAAKIAVEIWSPGGMARWTYRDLAAHVAAHAGGVPETVPPIVSRVAALVAEGPVHAGLVRRVVELSESIELTSRDTVLALSPLHCDGALAVSLLLPLARGARVLCLELDPDTAAADWRSVRIGRVVGTAADLERWRSSPARFGPQFSGFVCCDEF